MVPERRFTSGSPEQRPPGKANEFNEATDLWDIGPGAGGNAAGRTQWISHVVTLRIPYPLGFYAKGLDGRIDDAAAGWKGRGIWITSGDRTPWHKEGGKGTKPMVVHFQVRPSPLAD
jgi:hypothetical protein